MSVIARVGGVALPARRDGLGGLRLMLRPAGYVWSRILSDLVCAAAISAVAAQALSARSWMVLLVGVTVFVGTVAATGGYGVQPVMMPAREYRSVALGLVMLVAVAMGVTFFGIATLAPAPILLGAVSIAGASAALRTVQRVALATWRSRAENRMRALLVAPAHRSEQILAEFGKVRQDLEFVGALVPGATVGSAIGRGVEIVGDPSEARLMVEHAGVDVVVAVPGVMAPEQFRRLQWAVESSTAQMIVIPEIDETFANRIELGMMGATPTMTLLAPTRSQRVTKQVMDRLLGGLLLLLLSPLILGAMVMVKVTSEGPAIFRQIRVGQDGLPFTMLKLRTMVTDAERRREELLDASTGAGPLFKMATDPRITRVGRILRRFSIDELPQLWNVVRADMSLVGPRPPLVSEVATYDSMAVRRLHVKPGLTGLWQVSGRSDLSWEESVRLDLRYVDNWSVGYDLKILWLTASAVLGARGAY